MSDGLPAASSSTSDPRMSEGIRSGVNWMRGNSRPNTVPSASTSFVLETGNADHEAVTARQDGDERVFDDLLLAEDDGGDGLARLADLFDRGFGGMHDGGIETGGVRELSAHGVTPSCFRAFRPLRVPAFMCSGLPVLPVQDTLLTMHHRRMHHSCQCPPESWSASSPAACSFAAYSTRSRGVHRRSPPRRPKFCPAERAKVIQLARRA